mgnify:CR=1 FL=1
MISKIQYIKRYLPIANIIRLMKKGIDDDSKISKDAKLFI